MAQQANRKTSLLRAPRAGLAVVVASALLVAAAALVSERERRWPRA